MKRFYAFLAGILACWTTQAAAADSLAQSFQHPPASARPWVYWFWNNGNVTSNGITADLEAMQRVGIGGVLIMDVLERFAPPRGTAEFMNPEWQGLFEFAVQEAGRLGLEINMANGPGWCGSSGPWITPELSMQKLVWTNLVVAGPANLSLVLPQPEPTRPSHRDLTSDVQFKEYYADIALLAVPCGLPSAVPPAAVLDLSRNLAADGRLTWSVPPGQWLLQRVGHTTTGSSTRPPVAGGNGLECDKLSRAAMDAHFAGMMAKLIRTAGPLAGKSLVATHIDSWEVGAQNWTPKMRAEFQRRRGYDLLPWLPSLTDRSTVGAGGARVAPDVGDPAMAARFHWDFDQTLAELLAENYSGRLPELAHRSGLRYTLEGYDLPFGDEYTYTARADEPMTEFWTADSGGRTTRFKAREMASVAHVYGHAICGAESFTSGDNEAWKLTPADIKSLGDYEFSQGVNRFVVHRYAHQPYLDRVPGATMGPWGLHYERTQTWWELSGAWHQYLARCQWLLRQGKFVADLLYLRPERPNQTFFTPNPEPPAGHRYDEISAEALLQRVSVARGRLQLPDGMSYRALVLPPVTTMTPALARKIHGLVSQGATVVATAAAPAASPSLEDYPKCDTAVLNLGRELWGDCDGRSIRAHSLGRGRLTWGEPLAAVLESLGAPADFQATVALNWIHRHLAQAEVYFVANPANVAVETTCMFRVRGMTPELWNPETGESVSPAVYTPSEAGLTLPLRLAASGSIFVVFRPAPRAADPVVRFQRDGLPVVEPAHAPARLEIQSGIYGVPGDASRSRDVRAQVQALVDAGKTSFQVAELAQAGDPAYGVVKTLTLNYTLGDQPLRATGQDPDTLQLRALAPAPERPAELIRTAAGGLEVIACQPGRYDWVTASGQTGQVEVPAPPAALVIPGPWQLSFPPGRGAPASLTLPSLISWSDAAEAGVKYFSGAATYATTFQMDARQLELSGGRVRLALGDVRVMARVSVNGHDCGIAWQPPYGVDITSAVRRGENRLEIVVANLWPNRMIGDAALPAAQRFTWSSWEPFTPNTALLPSGLLGPVTVQFQTAAGP